MNTRDKTKEWNTYKASWTQIAYGRWILFWQRFGFYPQHAIMDDWYIGVFDQDTRFEQLKKDIKTSSKILRRNSCKDQETINKLKKNKQSLRQK